MLTRMTAPKLPVWVSYSAFAKSRDERLVQLLGARRIAGAEQARPAAAAHVGEQRELRHDQRRALHVDQAQVHPAGLVGEHAQIDELVGHAPHDRFVVIGCRTHQQHQTAADGCTLLAPASSQLTEPEAARCATTLTRA